MLGVGRVRGFTRRCFLIVQMSFLLVVDIVSPQWQNVSEL